MSNGNKSIIGRPALRGGALLLTLGLLLGLGGGILLSVLSPRLYRASATVLLDQSRPVALDYSSSLSGDRLTKTYAQLLTARPVLAATIATLGLHTSVEALARRVKSAAVRDTQLVALSVDDPAPDTATRIATALLDEFYKQNKTLEDNRLVPAQTSLEAQLTELRTNINATQASIAQLKPADAASADHARMTSLLTDEQATFSNLSARLAAVRAAAAQPLVTATIVEPPQAAADPVAPDTATYTLAGAALGLLLAGSVVVVRYHLAGVVGE